MRFGPFVPQAWRLDLVDRVYRWTVENPRQLG